ncbi:16S rRNA (guanine(966)-N(2))-methyltransferase RsmD [Luteibacter sahnii]|uniref:16S rRNA (guanine(966)-N(2))-methyltransferase RsmD n=1 Tax=Luteibacter sahnii TaxID=3021977 RepID=UPI002A6A5F3E|nr:16S rRNA (guanine(966)-N(2))-methyltransferase RsmD [Luteibacter sp. PPL193]MDY1547094.1 16S rRNA (guanine(966)-N(2))-methyltransferase RsmD [Luteibacter sp. PPL193]
MNGTGRIRVIGGSLRNSRLDVPDRPGLRPTTDRVRETLFNWLQPVIEGSRCLDLYAGTGALGIEALSRGAAMLTFVEREQALVAALKANLTRLKVQASVVADDAARWLKGGGKPFDVVFIDPPFADGAWDTAATLLEEGGWLSASAWIYVESPRAAVLRLPASWQPHRQGQAGEVAYTLYRRTLSDPLS